MKQLALLSIMLLLMSNDMESQVYQSNKRFETATLGGGCFWCLEAVFEQVEGVVDVVSGYSGGAVDNPSYQEVCNGNTGHAEVIQVRFDPLTISYHQILEIFFAIHDPTTLNRQGADVGTQYRSVIFYRDTQQQKVANEVILMLSKSKQFSSPIVTEVKPFEIFYKAEAYHQDYFANHPDQPYCRIVISPKVAKFKHQFKGL